MVEAARRLQAELDRRWSSSLPGRAPLVAVLGADVFGAAPDPDRSSATVHVGSSTIYVGPWGSGEGCGHCFALRWQRLRGRTERDAVETGRGMTAAGVWPQVTGFLADAVWHAFRAAMSPASERITGRLLDPDSAGLRRMTSVDVTSLRVLSAPLLADPRCPSCGTRGPEVSRTFEGFQSRPKRSPHQYRLSDPHDLPLPAGGLANPLCGTIGSGTLTYPWLPTTATVTGAIYVRGYAGLLDVAWSGHANRFTDSLRLAYLEGLERYAGTHNRRPVEPVIASYREVGEVALDPLRCGTYPDQTFDTDPLVDRFDPDQPIPWIWGHRVRSGTPILVPQRLVHYSSEMKMGDNFVLSSSNGCAAGSSLEEAVLFGLLELIERDAFIMAWYGRERLRRIDLRTCRDPGIRSMIEQGELAGYDVLAFDNRIDLSVPVVTTLARRRDGGPGLLSFAAGAHLEPEQAIRAALSETMSYIPTKSRTTRRRWDELSAMMDDHWRVQMVQDHADLFGHPGMLEHAQDYLDDRPVESVADLYPDPWPAAHDLRDDLERLLDELYRHGFEVIVVDQTPPDMVAMGVRAVCTIVPGLVPVDFGWGRQRALTMPRLLDRIAARGGDGPRMVPHPFP
ncbi:TOMM precursor leader peptide-binding protein [Jiangella alba]